MDTFGRSTGNDLTYEVGLRDSSIELRFGAGFGRRGNRSDKPQHGEALGRVSNRVGAFVFAPMSSAAKPEFFFETGHVILLWCRNSLL